MGPRQTSQFPPDLEPQYTLIITHQQTKWHTVRSTTVPRPSTKVRNGWLSTSWKSPPKIIEIILLCFVVVQLLGRVSLFGVPRTTACQVFLSFTIAWSLLQLMSIESVMASNHLIPHFTESKLTLLTARQANESQRWDAEAREIPLFGKSGDREDGRLAPQNKHLIEVWMPGSFINHKKAMRN